MRPLLISHSDGGGGAARACYRLHTAFRRAGVESKLLVGEKTTDDWSVERMSGRGRRVRAAVAPRFNNWATRLDGPEQGIRSLNAFPSGMPQRIAAMAPDVVNLHWVNHETLSIAEIGRIRAPVVMTLHDMWAFSGTDHYSPDGADAPWRDGYRSGNRLSRWAWRRKRDNWKPMHVISPSNWLADCARQSELMRDWPIHTVPNPVDVDVFRPLDRAFARQALGLPAEHRIVLFGAVGGLRDTRKGGDLLIAALNAIGPSGGELTAVVFGEDEPRDRPSVPMAMRWMGRVADDVTLALIYSAADVMVMPSRMENLGQTGVEAQACGLPVVSFDATGLVDIVEDRVTGFLADPFEPQGLAEGIRWVLADNDRRLKLAASARARATQLWRPEVVTRQYLEVFEAARAERSVEKHA